MADNPNVTYTTILASELCQAADPTTEDTTEYEFSNGRKFTRD